MIISRKVHGIQNLIVYMNSVDYQTTEETINELLKSKELPHLRPHRDTIVFNLDHIDWWLNLQRSKQ